MAELKTKVCTKCNTKKDIQSFTSSSYHCKECVKIYNVEYRKRNAEKIKRKTATYHQINKDKIKKRSAQWAKDNPEKVKAKQAKYVSKNKDKIKKAKKKYEANNKDKVRSWRAKYVLKNSETIKAKQRKHNRKTIEQLADYYIVRLLCQHNKLLTPETIPPELIALKRVQLKLKRYLKEI